MLEQRRTAVVETPSAIYELLRQRRSSRAFADRPIPAAVLRSLFAAARWVPSAGNGQSWAFIVATRDDAEEFARLLGVLTEKKQAWARHAAALVLAIAPTRRPDGKEHPLAFYDLGLAVENLVVEGMAHGVYAHQMSGCDPDAARRVFAIPEGYAPVVVIALGYPGNPDDLPEELRARERAPRERKPLPEFVFRARFDQVAPLVDDAEAASGPIRRGEWAGGGIVDVPRHQ
ncbi:MAG: nitroreductase family protein [Sphaerobacter sp.]|nr:nitroreductase family protein [Sphaerobacter sp.]